MFPARPRASPSLSFVLRSCTVHCYRFPADQRESHATATARCSTGKRTRTGVDTGFQRSPTTQTVHNACTLCTMTNVRFSASRPTVVSAKHSRSVSEWTHLANRTILPSAGFRTKRLSVQERQHRFSCYRIPYFGVLQSQTSTLASSNFIVLPRYLRTFVRLLLLVVYPTLHPSLRVDHPTT